MTGDTQSCKDIPVVLRSDVLSLFLFACHDLGYLQTLSYSPSRCEKCLSSWSPSGDCVHAQPPVFGDSQHPNYVFHLQQSLYGLKQAPRSWYHRFDQHALHIGFRHSVADSSLSFIITVLTLPTCYMFMTLC